jgi:xylose isomerase
VLQGGGLTHGGLNFDSKVRRQSIDPADLFHGHVGAMDLCARALLVAERMVADGRPAQALDARYAGWDSDVGKKLLSAASSLDNVAAHALQRNVDEQPVSGRQEACENLVNEYL